MSVVTDDGAQGVKAPEDCQLVRAAVSGDGASFDVLIDRYYSRVYNIMYRMCGADDAEDVTQDAFVRAVTGLRGRQYRGEGNFRTWLFRIAVNTAINHQRQRRRHQRVEGPPLDQVREPDSGRMELQIPDETYEPYKAVAAREVQRMTHEAIRRLHPKQQAALILVDLEALGYQEAAQVLQCPLGTLKSRLVRARAAFQREFKRQMGGEMDGVPLGSK